VSRKQIFKGTTLYKTRVVRNILNVYNDSTFEFNSDWYKEASILAQDWAILYNVDYLKVCGIIAALSPLKSWAENQRIATIFLKSQTKLHTIGMHNKALSIFHGEGDMDSILVNLNGNKIQNFFLNIAYPNHSEAVTIDRHAISVCLNRSIANIEGVGITDAQYEFLRLCYIEASELAKVRPSMMQSITWEKWRELKKLTIN